MSILPIRTESFRAVDVNTLPVAPRPEPMVEFPENVFGPPGVITRLTNMLHTIRTPDAPRPEVVAKGRELASDPSYPTPAHLSAVASELLGDAKPVAASPRVPSASSESAAHSSELKA